MKKRKKKEPKFQETGEFQRFRENPYLRNKKRVAFSCKRVIKPLDIMIIIFWGVKIQRVIEIQVQNAFSKARKNGHLCKGLNEPRERIV